MSKQPLESKIQNDIRSFLHARAWLTERMHGNAYQVGIPDLFCWHKKYGFRWLDIKRPVGHSLTKAQIQKWPQWESTELGVWIMTAASEEEYKKLFGPPNFRAYWKPSYDKHLRSLDSILDEITMDVEE
jgi:hypothetical protein